MWVVGVDPGLKNFAWCKFHFDAGRVEQCSSGQLTPVSVADDLPKQVREFDETIGALIGGCDLVAAERFMSRGVRAGTTGEVSNMALGILMLSAVSKSIAIELITPASWKNAYNKSSKAYGGKLDTLYKLCKTTPHELDAALIGLYGASKRLNPNNKHPFSAVVKKSERNAFLDMLENGSVNPLIDRRRKR